MPVDADRTAAGVAQQVLHLGGPLGVRRAAQAEAVREQAGPVLAGPILIVGEAFAEQVLPAVLGVVVIAVPPEPRGERLLLVGRWRRADDALVRLRLRREEAVK